MKIIHKYVSILGREYLTADEALRAEDRLPDLIAEWKGDLAALRAGTYGSSIPVSRAEQASMVPHWEKRIAEFEAQWAEVQAQRAEFAYYSNPFVRGVPWSEVTTEDLIATATHRYGTSAAGLAMRELVRRSIDKLPDGRPTRDFKVVCDESRGGPPGGNAIHLSFSVPMGMFLSLDEYAGDARARGIPVPAEIPDCAVWKGGHFAWFKVELTIDASRGSAP